MDYFLDNGDFEESILDEVLELIRIETTKVVTPTSTPTATSTNQIVQNTDPDASFNAGLKILIAVVCTLVIWIVIFYIVFRRRYKSKGDQEEPLMKRPEARPSSAEYSVLPPQTPPTETEQSQWSPNHGTLSSLDQIDVVPRIPLGDEGRLVNVGTLSNQPSIVDLPQGSVGIVHDHDVVRRDTTATNETAL